MQGPPVLKREARDWGYWFFLLFIICYSYIHIRGGEWFHIRKPSYPVILVDSYTDVRLSGSSLALSGTRNAGTTKALLFSWLCPSLAALPYQWHGPVNTKPSSSFWSTARASICVRLWWHKSHCSLPGRAPLIDRLLCHLHTQWRVYRLTKSCQPPSLLQIFQSMAHFHR